MKLKALLLGALGLLLTFASPALAAGGVGDVTKVPPVSNVFADAPVAKLNWTGVYIGGGVGYGLGSIDSDAALGSSPRSGAAHIGSGVPPVASRGALGDVVVGADAQIPGSLLVLGARAGYGLEDVSVSAGSASVTYKSGWHVDGRAGLAFGTALPYIFGGYGQVHANATGVDVPTLTGWRMGGGVEFQLPKTRMPWVTPTLALEYVHTDYRDVTVASVPGIGAKEDAAMIRLNFHFGDPYARR
jgi:Outer membrane protein beta-barrel domain